jgi:hypothetical protein
MHAMYVRMYVDCNGEWLYEQSWLAARVAQSAKATQDYAQWCCFKDKCVGEVHWAFLQSVRHTAIWCNSREADVYWASL